MLVVAVLTIIAFVVLFNMGSLETIGRADYVKVYNRTVTLTALEREARLAALASDLGLGEYVSSLNVGQDPDSAQEFVFNVLVLRHESDQLGIRPTSEEIKTMISDLPVFQTDGRFDPQKYLEFSSQTLGRLGFTEAQIEEVVADAVRFDRVRQLIESPITVPESEVMATARIFQRASGHVVVFEQTAYLSNEPLTDEAIQAAYERLSPQLIAPESRAVRYVRFGLSESDASLEGADRIRALQAVADKAADFADQVEAGSFDSALQQSGVEARTTLDFTAQGTVANVDGLPGSMAALADPLSVLARPAFLATGEGAVTNIVQDGDSFIMAEVVRVTPARELSLDEARDQIVQGLRLEAARGRMEEAAVVGLATLREALAAGAPVAEAATAANLRVVPFSAAPMDNMAMMEDRRYADAATLLEPGELGEYIPTGGGGFAVLLETREALPEAELETRREELVMFLRSQRAGVLFYEWLVTARQQAGISG